MDGRQDASFSLQPYNPSGMEGDGWPGLCPPKQEGRLKEGSDEAREGERTVPQHGMLPAFLSQGDLFRPFSNEKWLKTHITDPI